MDYQYSHCLVQSIFSLLTLFTEIVEFYGTLCKFYVKKLQWNLQICRIIPNREEARLFNDYAPIFNYFVYSRTIKLNTKSKLSNLFICLDIREQIVATVNLETTSNQQFARCPSFTRRNLSGYDDNLFWNVWIGIWC